MKVKLENKYTVRQTTHRDLTVINNSLLPTSIHFSYHVSVTVRFTPIENLE